MDVLVVLLATTGLAMGAHAAAGATRLVDLLSDAVSSPPTQNIALFARALLALCCRLLREQHASRRDSRHQFQALAGDLEVLKARFAPRKWVVAPFN